MGPVQRDRNRPQKEAAPIWPLIQLLKSQFWVWRGKIIECSQLGPTKLEAGEDTGAPHPKRAARMRLSGAKALALHGKGNL